MEMPREHRQRRRTALTLLLAASAGAVDGSGFLLLAGLFVAHMSGDSVHLALDFAAASWPLFAEYAAVIFFFVVGVAAGAALMHHAVRNMTLGPLAIGLSVECLLILAAMLVGVVAWHNAALARGAPTVTLPALAPLALAMGFQNTIIRDRDGRSVHTTYISGPLVTAIEEAVELALRAQSRLPDGSAFPSEPSIARLVLYAGVCVCYIIAALAAAEVERLIHFWAFTLPLAGLLAALIFDRLRPFYL